MQHALPWSQGMDACGQSTSALQSAFVALSRSVAYKLMDWLASKLPTKGHSKSSPNMLKPTKQFLPLSTLDCSVFVQLNSQP